VAEAWGGPRSLFPEMVGPGLQRVAPDPIHGGLTRHVLWRPTPGGVGGGVVMRGDQQGGCP